MLLTRLTFYGLRAALAAIRLLGLAQRGCRGLNHTLQSSAIRHHSNFLPQPVSTMPLSMSQEDNVVDNRPVPAAKATGAEAVAAFRAGQASAKKSKFADVPASASKVTSSSASQDKAEKKKRKSTAPPTSPPHSPAPPPISPPPSGSGRKRKAAAVQPAPQEEKADDDDDDENPSPLDAALADFVPASLAPLPSAAAGQPMWLFQFPAKFDVAAFSALSLSLPSASSVGVASRIISRFQLNGEHYRIIEAEPSESTDLINLFPTTSTSTTSSHNLTPGQPFTRLLRITLDHTTPHSTSNPSSSTATTGWQHSAAALKRKVAVPPAKGLVVQFRPIGWMDEGDRGLEVGERRGRGFRKVGYEVEEGAEGGESKGKEKKRRKKEEKREKESDAVVEEVGEKQKKKKKDKDKQKGSK